jgi:anti-anti-sigma regulatory factor
MSYKYIIELDILSLAPQLLSNQFNVGTQILKTEGKLITEAQFRKCVKSLFPYFSLVKINQVDITDSHYRQKLTANVTSLRKLKKDLRVTGIHREFFNVKVSEVDAQ